MPPVHACVCVSVVGMCVCEKCRIFVLSIGSVLFFFSFFWPILNMYNLCLILYITVTYTIHWNWCVEQWWKLIKKKNWKGCPQPMIGVTEHFIRGSPQLLIHYNNWDNKALCKGQFQTHDYTVVNEVTKHWIQGNPQPMTTLQWVMQQSTAYKSALI